MAGIEILPEVAPWIDSLLRDLAQPTPQLFAAKPRAEKWIPLSSIFEADDDGDGSWVTINGAHVFISAGSGRVSKGPKNLIGSRPALLAKAFTKKLEPGEDTEHAYRDPVTKQFDPRRAAYHDEVAKATIGNKVAPVGRAPIAVILGGGTASGKTTISREVIAANPEAVRIDPDEIKLDIPEYSALKASDPEHAAARTQEESSYLSKLIVADAVAKRLDFTLDSTTSGVAGIDLANKLVQNGYDVRAAFVDVPIDTAVQRANLRATSSKDPMNLGRFVPLAVIEKSHRGAAANFFQLKNTEGISSIKLYDNSGDAPKLVYQKEAGKETVYDQTRLEKYERKSKGLAERAIPGRGVGPVSDKRGFSRVRELVESSQGTGEKKGWLTLSEIISAES